MAKDYRDPDGTVSIQTVVIQSGQMLSNPISFSGNNSPGMLNMPAAWDAASISFRVSADGGATWQNLKKLADDSEYTATVSAGNAYILPASDFNCVRMLQIRSGTAAQGVAQTANRVLTITARAV